MASIGEFQSTEAVTKFLRNKDTDINDVFKFTTENLFKDSTDTANVLILPQKERFILELLIDRISQPNKQSEKYLYSQKTWTLFNFIWDECNKDSRLLTVRSKTMSKIKSADIFIRLVKGLYTNSMFKEIELIDQLTISLTRILGNLRIHLSDEQNVTLVNYLLLFIKENDGYSIEINERILALILNIFNLNNTPPLSYDTKHKSEFSRSCLANLVISINRYALTSKLKSELKGMICRIFFPDDDNKMIVTFIEQFARVEANNTLNNQEVLFLLRLMISKVTVLQLEEIVKLLLKLYSTYSTTLLKEVTDMNKTLSVDFLSSLVENALKSSNDDSVNLIIHCIKRSSDVAFKYTEQICTLCLDTNFASIPLLKELFESYAKTREIELLVKLWSSLVQKYPNTIYDSTEIIDFVSTKTITLSYTQLSKLVEEEIQIYLKNPSATPVFLLAVCKGFFSGVSGFIQNSLSKTLIQTMYKLKPLFSSLLIDVNTESSWKLKFYILNLFDIEEFEDEVKKMLLAKAVNTEYYYYSLLRIIEQDLIKCTDKFKAKFESYFNKKSSVEFKGKIFSRWFMILGTLFEEKSLKGFVAKFLDTSDECRITSLLQNGLLQTQPKITSHFIDYFITHKQYLPCLEYVSVYALTRGQRVQILDVMLKNLQQDYAQVVMLNIIKLPTFKSKLEMNFEALVEMAKYKNSKIEDIIEQILIIHIKQHVESTKYINNAFDILSKKIESLTKSNCEKIQQYLFVSLKLIKVAHSKFGEQTERLISLLVEKVTFILLDVSNLKVQIVTNLIEFLTTINIQNQSQLRIASSTKEIIRKLGTQYYEDTDFQNTLFGYMCSLNDYYKIEYLLGLYVVLPDLRNSVSVEYLIMQLSERKFQFIEAWYYIYKSIGDFTSEEDLNKYVKLCSLFILNVKKPENSDDIKVIHALFTHSISKIFSKHQNSNVNLEPILTCLKTVVSHKTWLFTQYSMELTMAMVANITTIESYGSLCQIISSIILYQRRRLSNRHHLVMTILIALMKTLFVQGEMVNDEAGLAFERLISNVCEPNSGHINVTSAYNGSSKDSEINDALGVLKAGLRKYIPVVILNYIKFYLQYKVDIRVKARLNNSVFIMLNLLTLNELNYINKSLDNQSRIIFRSLYEDYKKFYKWTEE